MTAALPTAKPIEPVTAVVPNWTVAETVAAPAARMPEACRVTVATPEASVRAVAAGVMVASVASVLKVTTALGTTAPAASFNVAFTVAGASMEIELTVAPAASVSASVIVGALGVAGVPPVVSEAEGAGPGLHPARTASVVAKKSVAESLEVTRLKNLWAK